ncbi:MAG: CehA/McbA family metallohydrolase [Bacteroidota bacterium]
MKKPEPEVIADAPLRVEPGNDIPVLLLVKDADEYPVRLLRAEAIVSCGGQKRVETLIAKSVALNKKWWWKIFHIDASGLRGWVEIDIQFDLSGSKGIRTYHNDNHRTSTHKPLKVFVADEPLPRLKDFLYGDLHSHSQYTEDQVEFGAPLEASLILSRALGLSFFAVTDHSYDLDDRVDDYLRNDPDLPKWNSLQQEVDVLNKRNKGFSIIRGEEVSCRSISGHNVHMLLFGGKRFVHGSGDSAERWLQTRSEHAIGEILGTKDPGVLAFAAHPAEDVPFLQRVLLHRGNWREQDIFAERLAGVQFANGSQTGLLRGVEQWVSALLKGNRLFAIAGNDAHGNFNRFRQLRIPFISIGESNDHRFGEMRTAVVAPHGPTEGGVLEAIGSGRCVVTNGPIAALSVRSNSGKSGIMGSSLRGAEFRVKIEARSSSEFGAFQRIVLWLGSIGGTKEVCLLEAGGAEYSFTHELRFSMKKAGYIRLDVRTSAVNDFDGAPHFCITNPIWINHP